MLIGLLEMKLMQVYISPDIEILDLYQEGVLCASNEIVTEIEGEW